MKRVNVTLIITFIFFIAIEITSCSERKEATPVVMDGKSEKPLEVEEMEN